MTLYDPQQHRASTFLYGDDSGVVCHSIAAWTLWSLGYPDQGLARSHEALLLAQQRAHPFSLGFALCWAAVLHQYRREVQAAQGHAEAAIRLATEFPLWKACGSMLRGWALAHQGQAQEDRAAPPGLDGLVCEWDRDSAVVFSGSLPRPMGP